MRPASLVLVFALASTGTACQALLRFSNDERGADGDATASASADSAPEASARDGGSNVDAQPPPRACGAPGDAGAYANAVLADRPRAYWRLDEPDGSSTVCDIMGSHAGAFTAGQPTRGTPGALANDPDPSTSFSGADSVVIPPGDLEFAGNAAMTIASLGHAGDAVQRLRARVHRPKARRATAPGIRAPPRKRRPEVRAGRREPYGFVGAIDEVAVYDRVLTKEGILAHFEASLTGPR